MSDISCVRCRRSPPENVVVFAPAKVYACRGDCADEIACDLFRHPLNWVLSAADTARILDYLAERCEEELAKLGYGNPSAPRRTP